MDNDGRYCARIGPQIIVTEAVRGITRPTHDVYRVSRPSRILAIGLREMVLFHPLETVMLLVSTRLCRSIAKHS